LQSRPYSTPYNPRRSIAGVSLSERKTFTLALNTPAKLSGVSSLSCPGSAGLDLFINRHRITTKLFRVLHSESNTSSRHYGKWRFISAAYVRHIKVTAEARYSRSGQDGFCNCTHGAEAPGYPRFWGHGFQGRNCFERPVAIRGSVPPRHKQKRRPMGAVSAFG
jgi:hypothetical protein